MNIINCSNLNFGTRFNDLKVALYKALHSVNQLKIQEPIGVFIDSLINYLNNKKISGIFKHAKFKNAIIFYSKFKFYGEIK